MSAMSDVKCTKCKRPLPLNETAYVQEWKVITPDGIRIENRYECYPNCVNRETEDN